MNENIKNYLDEKVGERWRKIIGQTVDQGLHFSWSGAALLPLIISPGLETGFLTGVLFSLPREFIDQWPINNWKNTALDILFFGSGGAAAGMFF
jgi:hypothetical protein